MNTQYSEPDFQFLYTKICEYNNSKKTNEKSAIYAWIKGFFNEIYQTKTPLKEFNQNSTAASLIGPQKPSFILDSLMAIDPRLSYKMLKCYEPSAQNNEVLIKISIALHDRGFLNKADKVLKEAYKNETVEFSQNKGVTDSILKSRICLRMDLENIPIAQKIAYLKILIQIFAIIPKLPKEVGEVFRQQIKDIREGEIGKAITGLVSCIFISYNMYSDLGEEAIEKIIHGRESSKFIIDNLVSLNNRITPPVFDMGMLDKKNENKENF